LTFCSVCSAVFDGSMPIDSMERYPEIKRILLTESF
jgi:hypothetical protein